MPVVAPQSEKRPRSKERGRCLIRRQSAAVLLSALALGGCGGEDEKTDRPSPADKAKATVAGFHSALVNSDGSKACGYLTDDAQEEIAAARLVSGASSVLDAPDPCVAAVDTLGFAETDDLGALVKSKVEDVDVSGDAAKVVIGEGEYELEERGGGFKLSSVEPASDLLAIDRRMK